MVVSSMASFKNPTNQTPVSTYLLIKLIDNAFCPLQMQVPNFCWAIYICQFDAHLAYQEAITFTTPFYTITINIISLFWKNRIIIGSEDTGVLLLFVFTKLS